MGGICCRSIRCKRSEISVKKMIIATIVYLLHKKILSAMLPIDFTNTNRKFLHVY